MAGRINPSAPAPLVQEYVASQIPAGQQQVQPQPVQQPVSVVQPVVAQQPQQQPANVFGGGGVSKPSYASLSLSKPVVKTGVNGVDGSQPAPAFRKDDTKKDGGFFGWLGGLGKKRNGRRAGETDDEYDERMTRNNARLATLADALRHMGNIYSTMKGAPSQQLNSGAAIYEQGLEKRKAERAAKAAAQQEAAYKAAQLQMKQDAQTATNAYREAVLGYKKSAEDRANADSAFNRDYRTKQYDRSVENDKWDHAYKESQAAEQQRHNRVSEGQGAARLGIESAKLALKRARGDGSDGGVGSVTNLATPNGHMNRKKDLNPIEKKQLFDYMKTNGWLTADAMRAYNTAQTVQEKGALLNGWIGWAANFAGAKGREFRKHLTDHYGYVETSAGGNASGGSGGSKSVVRVHSPAKGSAQKASGQSKFHVD